MKSVIIGIILVFFSSFANAMSWPELVELLNRPCPKEQPGGVIMVGVEDSETGLVETIKLFNLDKDTLPPAYSAYQKDIQDIRYIYAVDIYKKLGPLVEGGIWQINYIDKNNRHLQTYKINFKAIR